MEKKYQKEQDESLTNWPFIGFLLSMIFLTLFTYLNYHINDAIMKGQIKRDDLEFLQKQEEDSFARFIQSIHPMYKVTDVDNQVEYYTNLIQYRERDELGFTSELDSDEVLIKGSYKISKLK